MKKLRIPVTKIPVKIKSQGMKNPRIEKSSILGFEISDPQKFLTKANAFSNRQKTSINF